MFQVMLSETPASIMACLTDEAFPPFATIVTLVRPMQPENASDPMYVTLSGIVMLVSPLQLENVNSSMLVTLFGIVTLVRSFLPLIL